MEARREREDRKEIRAISLHPSGSMIMDEREVMDGRRGGGGGEISRRMHSELR